MFLVHGSLLPDTSVTVSQKKSGGSCNPCPGCWRGEDEGKTPGRQRPEPRRGRKGSGGAALGVFFGGAVSNISARLAAASRPCVPAVHTRGCTDTPAN